MDASTETYFKNLTSTDKEEQYVAYQKIMLVTKEPVNWAYEV
ncbi:hypothetical protein [Mesobacillus maritimus]